MNAPHRIARLILAAWIVALAVPSPARAQTNGIDRVQEMVERNAELLREATELIRSTNSIKARAALETARKLHEISLAQLREGNGLMAGKAAFEAREAILRAIAIAKREAKLEENALAAIERATQRLDQARAALEEFGGDDTPARKLVEESAEQLQRARNNVREHMFEIALQLANASTDMSNRAIRMLRRDGAGPEVVRREIARSQAVIERAEHVERPEQRRALDEARDLQARAVRSAHSENWRLALEQTHRAREIALRLLKSMSLDASSEDDVRRALEFTDDVLARATDIVREEALDEVGDAVAKASELQKRAWHEFDRGVPALEMTLRARDMAQAALRAADKPLGRDAVAPALDRTDEWIGRLRAALESNPDDEGRALLERSQERQAEARAAFDSGQLRKALALTKVARNIAQRALRRAGTENE